MIMTTYRRGPRPRNVRPKPEKPIPIAEQERQMLNRYIDKRNASGNNHNVELVLAPPSEQTSFKDMMSNAKKRKPSPPPEPENYGKQPKIDQNI
jgi:hypothetical protein